MDDMKYFLYEKAFREKIKSGGTVYGTFLHEITSSSVVKILEAAGFDFFVIDCEHGPFTYDDVAMLCASSDYESLIPVVRVPELRKEPVQKVLEAGAAALMVPAVKTPEEAREAVRLARYRPEGERGFATFYPFSNYTEAHPSEILKKANESLSIIIQIETAQAVECIDKIASVKGIDALLVGPGDLSLSYDIPGQPTHPRVVAAVEKILAAAKVKGLAAGIHCNGSDNALFWKEKGMNIITWSTPTMMIYDKAKEFVRSVK